MVDSFLAFPPKNLCTAEDFFGVLTRVMDVDGEAARDISGVGLPAPSSRREEISLLVPTLAGCMVANRSSISRFC